MSEKTEKKIEKKTELTILDQNQKDMILFDEEKNMFTTNPQFMAALAESPKLIALGHSLLETDINEIDEDEMSKLNKDIKPLSEYNKKFTDFRAAIKKKRDSQTKQILEQYDAILKSGSFDEIPPLMVELNRLKKDFKENRANKRWEQLNEIFQLQLEIYPDLENLSPRKLGSFSYYRVMHPDMVSEAKTKPVTEKTIKELNQDINNYATDISLLKNSALDPRYYEEVVDVYSAEPITSHMLTLIDEYLAKQLNDDRNTLIKKAQMKIKTELESLWTKNENINKKLNQLCSDKKLESAFNSKRLTLMNAELRAIANAVQMDNIIIDNTVDEYAITVELKQLIGASFERVNTELTSYIEQETKLKEKMQTKQQSETTKPESKKVEKVEIPKDPNQWILDHLQNQGWSEIHNNNVVKMQAIIELTTDFKLKVENSVWRSNIKSPDQFMDVVKFLTDI